MNSSLSKSREEKYIEYVEKYSNIPLDYKERLLWLYNHLKINDRLQEKIALKRDRLVQEMYYKQYQIILFEEPEGAPRPRFRFINRSNAANMALTSQNFVHIYSPIGRSDSVYMKRLVETQDILEYNTLIYTPCNITIRTYHKTPTNLSKVDTILAEIGLLRPLSKPDSDNIAKKYYDMFNSNVWLDDILVVDGTISKYWSVLPRVDITINYLNKVYTERQRDMIVNRTNDNSVEYFT